MLGCQYDRQIVDAIDHAAESHTAITLAMFSPGWRGPGHALSRKQLTFHPKIHSLPLNLQGNADHPFYKKLSDLRRRCMREAQRLPVVAN